MRKRLLSSANDLLARRPGTRPTTQDIADHAHVSIGTVYRYFADIDAIVEELRATAIHDITTSLATGVGRAMDAEPMAAMVTIVETLTAAFEKHDPVLRISYSTAEAEFGDAWAEVEEPLIPLARILPARLRPDLAPNELDDLVFLTMGATANLCLRIALLRPEGSNREALIATAARMLLAALMPMEAA
ncbi:TetR family transcriptional regulator [Gordonia sp. HNM0687]|uniref:TetR family transcriptional regulator n=1 Tax=Gordonia mangrovi TaxID=2665643 RepID=A0A6L7GUP6_9ACTN|nr:TetR/AcrR family transcriptional regulator [Gordonia mangrovi]MXP23666.1 TetR family transcriptional regulator [Gordonia mangrovi]UVF80641.1 TetR/AcrR family transcriptional regulator [Gordonia mangrovi]